MISEGYETEAFVGHGYKPKKGDCSGKVYLTKVNEAKTSREYHLYRCDKCGETWWI